MLTLEKKKGKTELFAMMKVSKADCLEQRLEICLVIESPVWQVASQIYDLLMLFLIL